jgi:hypothetical protein
MNTRRRIILLGVSVLVLISMALVFLRTGPGGNGARALMTLLLGNPPNSSVRSLFGGANNELRTIYAAVQNEANFQFAQGHSNALERAIIAIGESEGLVGYDFFRLSSATNQVWVAFHPDASLWHAPKAFEDEIAAYWPLGVVHPTTGTTGFVAVHFGGASAFLTNHPSWGPSEFPFKKSATGR